MDKKELLHKLTEYEIGLMKAKVGLLRAGMTDTSGYDGQIAAIEYVKTLATMLNETPVPPKEPGPNDALEKCSLYLLCGFVQDKCDEEAVVTNEFYRDKRDRIAAIEKLQKACEEFMSEWRKL